MASFPLPASLRLVRGPRARGAAPKPPFGLAAFVDDGDSAAIETDPDEALEALAHRIPHARELARGAVIVMLGGRTRGIVARLFGKATPVARDVRATALLARGYREIIALEDESSGDDLVLGIA